MLLNPHLSLQESSTIHHLPPNDLAYCNLVDELNTAFLIHSKLLQLLWFDDYYSSIFRRKVPGLIEQSDPVPPSFPRVVCWDQIGVNKICRHSPSPCVLRIDRTRQSNTF